MTTAANLHAQIEATLSSRVPSAFSLKIKQLPELFATGIAEADAILEGGIPRGSITEISGAASTGRTSFALTIIAGITQSGAACAWVDVHDALSPESAVAAGVVLERLLWLRTKSISTEQKKDAPIQKTQPSPPVLKRDPIHHGGGSGHPRNETRGMENAVSLLFKGEGGLLRDKSIGTPGRSNRPLSEPKCAEPLTRVQRNEQVAYDRLPSRRGEYFLNGPAEAMQSESRHTSSKPQRSTPEKPWSRLEQALKATDLLLQAGGFAAIVLDMSDVLPQHTMRIPLATWYRFRLAAEQARTALIFLTQSPCASSCAALALRCEPANVTPFSSNGETALFERQQYKLVRERNRNDGSPSLHKKPSTKKPSTRAEWRAETLWSRVR
jgi:recombination protein RecA